MNKLQLLDKDSLIEVLSRIPLKTLVDFKCISKEWHKFICTNRSFIKAYMENTESVPSGFIFQQTYTWSKEDIKSIRYINIPPLDQHHDKLNKRSKSTVHSKVFSFLPEDVVVLSSCNGLVCCRSCYSFSSPTKTNLYICNPSNKDWISLACPDYDKGDSIVLAFDPYKDPIDISTKFKLVRVKRHKLDREDWVDEDGDTFFHYFSFDLYSSETESWKQMDEICKCDGTIVSPGIYVGGFVHWLAFYDHILTFDIKNEVFLTTSTPVPAAELKATPEVCLGEWNRMLHYVMATEGGLHVWYLEAYFGAKWQLKFWKSSEEIEGENSQFSWNLRNSILQFLDPRGYPWMYPKSFKDGVLLIRAGVAFYFYDIEKEIMVEAGNIWGLCSECCPCLPVTIHPYGVSLVPLKQA